jgi:hypothetical protein
MVTALSPKQTRNLGALAVLVVIGVFVGYYTKSIVWGIGVAVGVGVLYGSSLAVVDWARMRTNAFITNIGVKGHSSIIPDDKYPVASPVKGDPNYMIMCAGGSGIVELPMHGFGPYYICPEEYIEETNSATIAIADWMKVPYTGLPRFLREALSWQVHFNPLTSEIYFAETSPINGTSTQSNLNLAEKIVRLNNTITSLETVNETLNKAVRSNILLHKESEENQNVRIIQVPVDKKE